MTKRILLTLGVTSGLLISGCGGGGGGGGTSIDPLKKGLIHEWAFAGNANDSVGTLNGTVIGAITYNTAPPGQGMVLDGSTMGINFPPANDLQFQASFTVSAWANLTSYPSGGKQWNTIMFDGDDRGGLDSWYISVDPSGNLQFEICGAQFPANPASINGTMPLNQWVLVTATYDQAAGAMRLYQNGVQTVQLLGNATLTPVVAFDPNYHPGEGIGVNNNFPNGPFNFAWPGMISDVRIYDRALSPSEAMSLYNRTRG